MLIFENFIPFIIKNKKDSNDIKYNTILNIYRNFSISDSLDYEIYINQAWILYLYNCIYKCSESSYIMSLMKSYSVNKTHTIKYSSLLNKTSFEYYNAKYISNIELSFLKASQSLTSFDLYDYIQNNNTKTQLEKETDISKEEIDKLLSILK